MTLFVTGMIGFAWLLGAGYWAFSARALLDQRDFRSVEARVLAAKITRGEIIRFTHNCSTGDDRGPRHLQVQYAYDVDGRRFTSWAYDHSYDGELFCDQMSAHAALVAVKAAGTVTAYYDPDDPRRAVLQLEDRAEVIVLVSFFGVSGVVLWGIFFRELIRYRRARRTIYDI